MSVDEKITQMVIEARKFEAEGDYIAAANIEFQIIKLKKEHGNVS